jgi:hypothetical protein
MRFTQVSKVIMPMIVAIIVTLPSSAQTQSQSTAANLAPMAFLTTHEWDAALPDMPDGKKKRIHAQFSWTQNGQGIRISNQFVTDGKRTPYIDGLYVWDPQERVIRFWYVGAEGAFTKGVVKVEEGKLVHEFQETKPDGKIAEYICHVTPHGETDWENEIFARTEKGLALIVKVRYEATH